MLGAIGAWREGWVAPGTGPVEYLDALGVIGERTLAVHGVQLNDESLSRLRDRGATLVTCPRSNEWVGIGAPPIARFFASGVAVAVGTDSLASVEDLNLFSELAAMRRMAPEVPARQILESGTVTGARALGLDALLGTLAPGRLAEVLAVQLPEAVTDVEEYLVSGVPSSALAWAASSETPGCRL
jgi:cytosine/adenosine deaminase-related metal-dependent hydrolase